MIILYTHTTANKTKTTRPTKSSSDYDSMVRYGFGTITSLSLT